MDLINEAFINGFSSIIEKNLLNNNQLDLIKNTSSFNELLKILNRSNYLNLSSKLQENNIINMELLFYNELFELVKTIKQFSSKRIRNLLTIFYDFFFGFYNSISDFKKTEPVFKSIKSSYDLSINNKDQFYEYFKQLIAQESINFNELDKKSINSFLNYRLGNDFKLQKNNLSVINNLLTSLFLKEKEIKIIFKTIRRLKW